MKAVSGQSTEPKAHRPGRPRLRRRRHRRDQSPAIQALVYVAALAPDEGETVADVFYRNPPHPLAPELKPDDDGWIWLPTTPFPQPSPSTRRPKSIPCCRGPATHRRPSIQKPVPRPGWKDIPSWYLVAEEDRMINPETQTFMAERMNATTRTYAADQRR